MKTREELLSEIKTSKKVKVGAFIMMILSVATYLFFDTKQIKAENELMILDQGRLDETVLE